VPAGPEVVFIAGQLGEGGAERQLYAMVAALVEGGSGNGGHVSVLSMTRGEVWEDRLRELGVDVRWTGVSPRRSARLASVLRAVRETRPDVVQSAHFSTNLYASIAARSCGAREIGAIRNDLDASLSDVGRLGRLSLRVPRTIAVNSQRALTQAVEAGVAADRLVLLPNVVDTTTFHPTVRADADGSVRLLWMGRLARQKRPDRFLRVVASLFASGQHPDVFARVVGAGPLRPDVESAIRTLGLDDRVELAAHADTPGAYHDADILVLTSDFEGTPNVVLEAMACGLPIVASSVGDVPDLVDDGVSGFVVPAGDEAAFARAIERLLGDDALRIRMGDAARQSVEAARSTTTLRGRLLDLYRTAGVRSSMVAPCAG